MHCISPLDVDSCCAAEVPSRAAYRFDWPAWDGVKAKQQAPDPTLDQVKRLALISKHLGRVQPASPGAQVQGARSEASSEPDVEDSMGALWDAELAGASTDTWNQLRRSLWLVLKLAPSWQIRLVE